MFAVSSLLCRRATTRLVGLPPSFLAVAGHPVRWASSKKVAGKSTTTTTTTPDIGKKKDAPKAAKEKVKAEKETPTKPTKTSTPSTTTTTTSSPSLDTSPNPTTTPKTKKVSSKTKKAATQEPDSSDKGLLNNINTAGIDGKPTELKPTKIKSTPIVEAKNEQEPAIPPKPTKKSRDQLIQEQLGAIKPKQAPQQAPHAPQQSQKPQLQQQPEQKNELKVYSQKAGDILKSQPQDYLEAIKLFETALRHATEEGNTKQVYSILFAIATTYFKNKDWVKAVGVHKDIAKFCKRVNRPDLESLSITTIGSILSQYENGDSGKQFLELGLKIANQEPTKHCTQEGMNIARMSALEGLGDFERLISNDSEKAEEYYKEGLKIAEKDDNLNYKFKFQAQLLLEDEEGDEVSSEDPDVTEDKS